MRLVTDHVVNPVNDQLTIEVIDEPGSGGANHLYEVSGYRGQSGHEGALIEFQNGPIAEVARPRQLFMFLHTTFHEVADV